MAWLSGRLLRRVGGRCVYPLASWVVCVRALREGVARRLGGGGCGSRWGWSWALGWATWATWKAPKWSRSSCVVVGSRARGGQAQERRV